MSYNSFAYYYDELTKNVDYKGRAEYICEILKKYNIKDGLLLDLARFQLNFQNWVLK